MKKSSDRPRVAVILAAAGLAQRMGQDKLLMRLKGKTVIRRSAEAFVNALGSCRIIAAVSNKNASFIAAELEEFGAELVQGGASRAESIKLALARLNGEEIVLIHDGARPLVSEKLIRRAAQYAEQYGAAAPAVPVKDTIRVCSGGFGAETLERSTLRAIQTPQAFRASELVRAYETASLQETDDAAVYEKAGGRVYLFEGENTNLKLTSPEDFYAAQAILGGGKTMRVGNGYDVHAFAEGRKLILGGVEISHEKGLAGHSDADVLIHAIMDALLGAAALGDIGKHFPDTDQVYKDIDSRKLLARAGELLERRGYRVGNIDAIVIAQAPKLSPHISLMRRNIAQTLGIGEECVSIKATTTEGLGFEGRKEGIAAQASVLIEEI